MTRRVSAVLLALGLVAGAVQAAEAASSTAAWSCAIASPAEAPGLVSQVPAGLAPPDGCRAGDARIEQSHPVDPIVCPILALIFPPHGDIVVWYVVFVLYPDGTWAVFVVPVTIWDCPPYDAASAGAGAGTTGTRRSGS